MESFLFMDWAVLLFGLMALGSVTGFFAGLLGIGGGAILVPGLYYTFFYLGFPQNHLMHIALGTSLAVIVPTAISSARAHYMRKSVDLNLVKNIGVGIFFGAIIGAFLADQMSTEFLKVFFACATLILAVLMVSNPVQFICFKRGLSQPFAAIFGLGSGVVASLMGIGAASLTVPYMSMCRVEIHRAIGTASALGLMISVPATLTYMFTGWEEAFLPPLSIGYVNAPAWFVIMIMSILFAPLGAYVAHKIRVQNMRKVFAVFLILVATKMILDVWL